jgi:hypothetical protein
MEDGKMFKKILMAAGLAAAFSLSPQPAEAKVNVYIGIGEPGGYCYYNYDPFRCGGFGYYPVFRDHLSCRQATRILRDRGYRNIIATDCRGKTYTFIARKRGGEFRIKFNSYSGRITSVRPL